MLFYLFYLSVVERDEGVKVHWFGEGPWGEEVEAVWSWHGSATNCLLQRQWAADEESWLAEAVAVRVGWWQSVSGSLGSKDGLGVSLWVEHTECWVNRVCCLAVQNIRDAEGTLYWVKGDVVFDLSGCRPANTPDIVFFYQAVHASIHKGIYYCRN